MHAVTRFYSGPGAKELFDLLAERKEDVESAMRETHGFVAYTLVATEDGGMSVPSATTKPVQTTVSSGRAHGSKRMRRKYMSALPLCPKGTSSCSWGDRTCKGPARRRLSKEARTVSRGPAVLGSSNSAFCAGQQGVEAPAGSVCLLRLEGRWSAGG